MTTMDTTTKAELSALNGTRVTGQIVERYNEPEWLSVARTSAWKQYAEAVSPSRVEHLWRYTDPGVFEPTTDVLSIASAGTVGEVDMPDPESEQLSGYAVWSNGTVSKSHLDSQLQQAGVMLMDLHDASTQHQSLVEKHLGSAVGADYGKFEALNAAAWQAGLLVYIPRGVVVQKPLHVIFAGNDVTPFFAPRLLVVVEEGAQLTLVNEFTSPRQAEMSANAVLETIVEQAAHLRQVTVQSWGDRTVSYITHRANIARDGQYLSVFAGLGAGVSKADIGSRLNGRGSNAKLLGVSFGQNNQHFDHHTVHDHRSGDSYSDLDFKVVLKDEARSVYTGLIRIEHDAANCEAYQENRNLLLSEGTRADTIPELEILTDEVRCSHGATIGPLDEQEIFYLTARGIHRDEAIRMVVNGFVEPTLREVPEDLRERLTSYIVERVREI
jgi:Fe-S cluster assembly protein SufD